MLRSLFRLKFNKTIYNKFIRFDYLISDEAVADFIFVQKSLTLQSSISILNMASKISISQT